MSLFSFKPVKHLMSNGETIWLRRISAAERSDWLDSSPVAAEGAEVTVAAMQQYQARLLLVGLCDELGNRMFGKDKVAELYDIPAQLNDELFDAIARLNALTKEGEADLGKKSASAGPNAISSPSSPENSTDQSPSS